MVLILHVPLSVRNENSLSVIKTVDLKLNQNLPAFEPFMKRRKMLLLNSQGVGIHWVCF